MYNYMSSIDNVTIDSSVSFNDPGKNLFTTVRPLGFAVVFPSIYVSSIEVYKQSHLSIAYQLKKKVKLKGKVHVQPRDEEISQRFAQENITPSQTQFSSIQDWKAFILANTGRTICYIKKWL